MSPRKITRRIYCTRYGHVFGSPDTKWPQRHGVDALIDFECQSGGGCACCQIFKDREGKK